MDVKSVFLNGFINEEVYVAQPLGISQLTVESETSRDDKVLFRVRDIAAGIVGEGMSRRLGLRRSEERAEWREKSPMSTEKQLSERRKGSP
ncbi:hypothetical protein Tco_0792743 [Tanacetum coccineum]